MGTDLTNDDLVKQSSMVVDYSHKILKEENVEQHIINQIDNPDGRIKFKDIRKIRIYK